MLFFRAITQIVTSIYFEPFMHAVICVNVALVVVETQQNAVREDTQKALLFDTIESVFSFIYFLEAVMKVSALGFVYYIHWNKNKFDLMCVMGSILVELSASWMSPSSSTSMNVKVIVVFIRITRLLRLLAEIRSFRTILATFIALLPKFALIITMLVTAYLTLGQIGITAFGGYMYEGNDDVVIMPYAQSNYYPMNFNDFGAACMCLFCLLVLNNWYVFMEAYAAVMKTGWARIFFIGYWFFVNCIIINICISYVLDTFFEEIDKNVQRRKEERRKKANQVSEENVMMQPLTSYQKLRIAQNKKKIEQVNRQGCFGQITYFLHRLTLKYYQLQKAFQDGDDDHDEDQAQDQKEQEKQHEESKKREDALLFEIEGLKLRVRELEMIAFHYRYGGSSRILWG